MNNPLLFVQFLIAEFVNTLFNRLQISFLPVSVSLLISVLITLYPQFYYFSETVAAVELKKVCWEQSAI